MTNLAALTDADLDALRLAVLLEQERRYLLDTAVTTVGRHPEADIFFDDVTVSRRHAEITRTGGFFELVDQRSLNGSYVNGERVDRAVLDDGAEVRIGKFRLNFFLSPADRAAVAGA